MVRAKRPENMSHVPFVVSVLRDPLFDKFTPPHHREALIDVYFAHPDLAAILVTAAFTHLFSDSDWKDWLADTMLEYAAHLRGSESCTARTERAAGGTDAPAAPRSSGAKRRAG